MIDFEKHARETVVANGWLKKIDEAQYDNFDKYVAVISEINDLGVAKIIIKRLLGRLEP